MILTYENDVIEMEQQPIVQIWKDGELLEVIYMDSNWFISVYARSEIMMAKRPYIAKFGFAEIAIVDVAEFTGERRDICTEK